MQRIPWSARDVWIGIGALVLWMVLAMGASALVDWLSFEIDPGLFLSVTELGLLVPVWLVMRKYGAGWRALGLRPFSWGGLGLGCGLMIVLSFVNATYAAVLFQFDLRAQPDLLPILADLDSPWFFVLGAAVVAPFVEEVFFRGLLFGGLRRRFDWKVAAAISAALFAAIHLQPLAIPPIFLLGYLFAFLYHRTGSLWPSILMHLSTNTLAVAAVYLRMWLETVTPV
ncbi:MAG: type II CAAX endopeptidase family protein [Anaerolineae bacterium]